MQPANLGGPVRAVGRGGLFCVLRELAGRTYGGRDTEAEGGFVPRVEPGDDRRLVQRHGVLSDSNSGRPLLLPPADWRRMIAAWATQMPLSIKTLTELIKATGGGQCALAASAVPAGLLVAEGACACAAADAAEPQHCLWCGGDSVASQEGGPADQDERREHPPQRRAVALGSVHRTVNVWKVWEVWKVLRC